MLTTLSNAQLINCPNNSVYLHTGTKIIEQSLPLPAISNTILSGLPIGSNGLAIGSAFGFSAPDPTFWVTAGGNYWYYNGSAWVNTGHSTGNINALNIGSGRTCLYNLVGNTGQIYVYNGTGNGTLLTTVAGFNGGGPFDIIADMNDNFYLVKATVPNPSLFIYSPLGLALCSYSLSNLPNLSGGGGFGIVNDLLAVYNNSFSIGKINSNSPTITFTAQSSITTAIDFANCVVPVPTGSILAPMGGTLDCSNTTLPLFASIIPGGIGTISSFAPGSLVAGSYTWSGPGIISGQSTATINVNLPGIYTFTVFTSGCPSQRVIQSYSVNNGGLVFNPVISGSACFLGSGVLSVSLNSNTNTLVWAGPAILSPPSNATVAIGAAGVYSVTITNSLGCSGAATYNIPASPVISAALSSNSMCSMANNNSPTTISITPSGANSYTLLTSAGFTASSVAPWLCSRSGTMQSLLSIATATVIGLTGQCSGSTTISFSIIPNPTIIITPSVSAICFGASRILTVFGASSYSWLPSTGLSSMSNVSVNANPSASSLYSVYGSVNGCNSSIVSSNLSVLPLPTVFANPASATICSGFNATLSASGTASSYTWSSSAAATGMLSAIVSVNPVSLTSYTVTGSLNGCVNSATAVVITVAPPVLSMILSENTVCAQPINGSPNAITLAAQGASTYTLLPGLGYSVISPFTSPMTIFSNAPQGNIFIATATLLGSNGFCQVSSQKSFSIIPNPIISSLPSTAIICPGESKVFNVSGATSYSWSAINVGQNFTFGNTINTSPTITTVYSVIGEQAGCLSTAMANILNVSGLPNISIVAASSTVCAGTKVVLKVNGNADAYNWVPASGLSSASGPTVVASPQASQVYTVIGSLNTCTTAAVTSISLIASPSIAVQASSYTICSGASVNLYASGAFTYNWSQSTGTNPTLGQHIIVSLLRSTTFSVQGSNGLCSGSNTVHIKTIPIPNVLVEASAYQLCLGGTANLKAIGAQQYNWSPSIGLSNIAGAEVIAKPIVSTTYTITGINFEGNLSCVQQVNYPVIVVPTAQVVVGGDKKICMGESAVLTASGGDTYIWQPSEGLNKSSGNIVIARPLVSTVYSVEASYGGYCGSIKTTVVNVHAKPVVDAGRDTSFNADAPMMIAAKGTGNLKWIFGDGIACLDCSATSIHPKKTNCYWVEATNDAGCKTVDDICVTVTQEFTAYFPNSFSPNNDGLNDVFLIPGEGISGVTVDIYNRWGEKVFSSQDQSIGWDGQFKGLDCDAGVYIYKVSYKGLNGKIFEKAGSVAVVR